MERGVGVGVGGGGGGGGVRLKEATKTSTYISTALVNFIIKYFERKT